MPDLQPVKTKEEIITEICIQEDLIESAIPKIGILINKFPEAWLGSISSNYKTFLDYCDCILKKYDEEVKPLETKT